MLSRGSHWILTGRTFVRSATLRRRYLSEKPSSPQTNAAPSETVQERVTATVVDQPGPKAPLPEPRSAQVTDIGSIPDPHTNDPKKWQKFAWKYLGAAVVFGFAYNAVHRYVDQKEAEAKERREDLERAKVEVHETAAERAARMKDDMEKAEELLAQAKNPLRPNEQQPNPEKTGENASEADGTAVTSAPPSADQPFRLFKPVQEEENFVSEEDELRVLELELLARLRKLREAPKRTRENDAEKRIVKQELRDVRAELEEFANKNRTQ